jgi:hypothetical protein
LMILTAVFQALEKSIGIRPSHENVCEGCCNYRIIVPAEVC